MITKRLTNKELRQIIDSHEKGYGMCVPVNCDYLMAKELLAVREAQPVAWQQRFIGDHCQSCSKLMFDYLSENPDPIVEVREVYAAPPAPTMPDAYTLVAEAWRLMDGQNPATSEWHSAASSYLNACRAAMLQSCDRVRDLSTPVDPQIAEYEQALDMVGMSVSVDVSTSDDNAGYRYFGRVTEVQQSANPKDKGGVVLLVQDDVESNFDGGIAPDGFKLVPAEPTKEMCDAVLGRACFSRGGEGARYIYLTMLAAAPTPTNQGADDA